MILSQGTTLNLIATRRNVLIAENENTDKFEVKPLDGFKKQLEKANKPGQQRSALVTLTHLNDTHSIKGSSSHLPSGFLKYLINNKNLSIKFFSVYEKIASVLCKSDIQQDIHVFFLLEDKIEITRLNLRGKKLNRVEIEEVIGFDLTDLAKKHFGEKIDFMKLLSFLENEYVHLENFRQAVIDSENDDLKKECIFSLSKFRALVDGDINDLGSISINSLDEFARSVFSVLEGVGEKYISEIVYVAGYFANTLKIFYPSIEPLGYNLLLRTNIQANIYPTVKHSVGIGLNQNHRLAVIEKGNNIKDYWRAELIPRFFYFQNAKNIKVSYFQGKKVTDVIIPFQEIDELLNLNSLSINPKTLIPIRIAFSFSGLNNLYLHLVVGENSIIKLVDYE